MKRIAVLTSGGDSPGMNAAVRSVVRCAIDRDMEVYGIYRGYEGLLDGDIKPLTRRDVGDTLHRGGTILKTARSMRFQSEDGEHKAAEMLRTFGIEGLVVIGGDGSLRGALALSKHGIKVMGLPGTIDNDLAYTDYTIGFDTAVNTVLESISKIRDTSSSHERTSVIEVMGRHCGDIALYAGLTGGAEVVLIPEIEYNINHVLRKIISSANEGKEHSIILNAEGSGISSQDLVKELEEKTGRETRLIILSYVQRGGTPSAKDRYLATLMGAKAVELLSLDSQSQAIGIAEGRIRSYDLEQALEMKRQADWFTYELIDVLSK